MILLTLLCLSALRLNCVEGCWNFLHYCFSIILTLLSRECIIEDQAFSPSYDLSPLPPPIPPPPTSTVSKLDRRHTGRLRKGDNFLRVGGCEGGAKSYQARKPGPL
jgi:hypothetical protein